MSAHLAGAAPISCQVYIGLTAVMCLGEMAIYAPISGGYIHFAERWVHPAIGFAMGWQVSIQYCISAPSEMIAANILVSFWDEAFTRAHQAAYITAFVVVAALIVSSAHRSTTSRATVGCGSGASSSSGWQRSRSSS